MDKKTKAEWVSLAERLQAAGPEKHDEVLAALREVVEATEVIASYDWQLFARGRPRKTYRG